jgi:hypothetical protein
MTKITMAVLLAGLCLNSFAHESVCTEYHLEQVESPMESDSEVFLHNLDRHQLRLLSYTGRQADDELVSKFAIEACQERRSHFEEDLRERGQVGGIDPRSINVQKRLGTLTKTACDGVKTKIPLCFLDGALSNGATFKISFFKFDGPHAKEHCTLSLESLNMMMTPVVHKDCRQLDDGSYELRIVSIVGNKF